MADVPRPDALLSQEAPCRQSIVQRRRKRMLRCKAVSQGERADPGCPAGLGHQAAMAEDGSRAVAAAMKEQENTGGIAAWGSRPFAGNTIYVHRFERDVVCHGPDRPDLVETLASLLPSNRPRLGTQQGSNSLDLALVHRLYPIHRTGSQRPSWPELADVAHSGTLWEPKVRARRNGTGFQPKSKADQAFRRRSGPKCPFSVAASRSARRDAPEVRSTSGLCQYC